ncbi:DUF4153 domain-containing protein [Tenacibaculum sp. TC6]|uniref:DUF4153 domain-containing protein n=1 Tax=Tenacibaculum sp. TC6 TaxID=3423223 RepID=UPI003D368D68
MKEKTFLSAFTIKFEEAPKRFPITIIWSILGTIITLFAIESKNFNTHFWSKIIITFILGVSWLIATKLIKEQLKRNTYWIYLLPLLVLTFFYISIPEKEKNIDEESSIRFFLYFLSGHLLVVLAPFLFYWNKEAFFNYLKNTFLAIAKSLFFSLVLCLGIFLALSAIEHLFDINFKENRFFQVFVACLGIINTWIYVADVPKGIHEAQTVDYTKGLEILVKYILLPLTVIYLVILYAYGLKIVINWNLPKGWVSYLVVILSLLGFTIQLLINPIQKSTKSVLIKNFYPWFYYLMLPLVLLLFTAITRRISDYGVTEKRYFVLVLAIWILAMILYMLFSNTKKVKIFITSLLVICMMISFGFWGVFSVATNSQIRQFEKVYTKIKEENFTVSQSRKNQLTSIIYYLDKKDQLNKLESILQYNPETTFKETESWKIPQKIIDSLHLKVIDEESYKYRYFNINETHLLFDVKDYDALKIMFFNGFNSEENKINNYYFQLDETKNQLVIDNKKGIKYEIDLKEKAMQLLKLSSDYNVDLSYVTIVEEFEKLKIKIVFENINIQQEGKTFKITNAKGYVLIKEKNAI